jgi:hypothetical protein
VIPTKWSQAPRTVFAKTWSASITIRRPGGTKGPFNETTGTYPITPYAPHYTGTARIQRLSTEAQEQLVAEQQITTAGYQITTDLAADGCDVNDLVHVTAVDDNGDPDLPGTDLQVHSIGSGSLAWERVLIASINLG